MQKKRSRLFEIWVEYLCAMGKWLGIALVTGAVCGVCGAVFHIGVHRVTLLRAAKPWLLYTLPALGLLIVGLYKLLGTEGQSTNDILDEIHSGYGVSIALLPAIFFATLLTHLGGGSVGREGAALQMGGAIGYQSGRLLRLDDSDLRTMTTVGMAAFFSALFGTPVAAAVFALEITSVGRMYLAQLFPCLVAALTACGVSLLFGVEPTAFALTAPPVEAAMLARVGLLAVLGALRTMADEEPSLGVAWNEQLQEVRLRLMGEIQLEVVRETLREQILYTAFPSDKAEYMPGAIYQTDVYRPRNVMHYQRTLFFPLQQTGNYKSRISNLKVEANRRPTP